MDRAKITPDMEPEIIKTYKKYGIRAAAEMLGISKSAIYRRVNAGRPTKPHTAKPIAVPPEPMTRVTRTITACDGCQWAFPAGGGKHSCLMISCDKVRKIIVDREVQG